MLKRPETWLVLCIGVGVILYGLSPSPEESVERIEARKRAEATAQAVLATSAVEKRSPQKRRIVRPKPKPKPIKDLTYMKKNGLLGMPAQFVNDVFDSPYWTTLEPKVFQHENGSTVEVDIDKNRVKRAYFTFSPDLSSAAMQNVLDGILGYETNSPLHLEDLAIGETPVSGKYVDKEGQVFQFRGDRRPFKDTEKFTAWLEFYTP